ncbi:hypothetical protein HZ996_11810 [Cryomorphaceae bacterium]|nr:hypothetical protein HZ996_11810 [Cryomorphaceae bacterium]
MRWLIPCMLVLFSCSPRGSEIPLLNSGVQFSNDINRGVSFENPEGESFNLRYIPVRVQNDTTISITIDLYFPKGYLSGFEDEGFRVIPLERQWAVNGVDITKAMIAELWPTVLQPTMSLTLDPGEEALFGLGAVYPKPAVSRGLLPKTLGFETQTDTSGCLLLRGADGVASNLSLRLKTGDQCLVIPCGSLRAGN